MNKKNSLQPINYDNLPPMNTETVTPDYFVRHYKEIIIMYIANGRPSRDTLIGRYSHIDQFIAWCIEQKIHPLNVKEYHIRIYLTWLHGQGYKKDSVSVKLVALRSFFNAAKKINVTEENPCGDIHMGMSFRSDAAASFFTPAELFKIAKVWQTESNDFLRWRNTAIMYLMGVEGLRNIEIHRMNREDVDWDIGSIYIHGKGHDRQIFPCAETFDALKNYLAASPPPKIDGESVTPMFLSDSNHNVGGRISRNGIRFIMDNALRAVGLKKKGISCHVFRHSCGTNLYAAEKDLRLVQEVLGHRDPKTTARYSHIHDRATRRATHAIIPQESRSD